MPRRPDQRNRNFFVAAVLVGGTAVFLHSMRELRANPPEAGWFVLAALTLLTGSFTVKLPSLSAKISVSETFVFTSVLLFGSAAGTITVVLDALVISLWMRRDKRSATQVLFNATSAAIAIRLASETFFLLCGATADQLDRDDIHLYIAPLFVFALLYFVANTALVSIAIAFERNDSPWRIWWSHFPPVSLTYFVGSSVALLIFGHTHQIGFPVISIILPLLLISYVTFRTSMGRLEDATRHATQMNELYVSTVEALAMAVDAKDQVTHGHIRRVQVYAVELARHLGIEDTTQIKAIQSAALLHDMGKLAIPEHILNKPGKLTAAEFAKMKRHADIGANLLSSIKFPYPVIPIVRHHHENWDGSGYPAGLAGPDIPVGARVLSVVDCFDALTSDRPYRPSLSNSDAFAILQQRRGNMYDPLVVDTFIRVFPEIAPAARTAGEDARTLSTNSILELTPLHDIRESAAQAAVLLEYERALTQQRSVKECLEVTLGCVRRLTPATVCAFFRHIPESDNIICIATAGDPEHNLAGMSIKNGERISGWAFANDRTIANSEATLDLGDNVDLFTPALRSALVTPLRGKTRRWGTLSAYGIKDAPFTDDHKYALERIAAALGCHLDAVGNNVAQTSIIRFPIAAESRGCFNQRQ